LTRRKSIGESRTELVGNEGFLRRKKEGGEINMRGTLRYRSAEMNRRAYEIIMILKALAWFALGVCFPFVPCDVSLILLDIDKGLTFSSVMPSPNKLITSITNFITYINFSSGEV